MKRIYTRLIYCILIKDYSIILVRKIKEFLFPLQRVYSVAYTSKTTTSSTNDIENLEVIVWMCPKQWSSDKLKHHDYYLHCYSNQIISSFNNILYSHWNTWILLCIYEFIVIIYFLNQIKGPLILKLLRPNSTSS